MSKKSAKKPLYHPKNLPVWLLVAMVWLLSKLPYRCYWPIGRLLGKLSLRLDKKSLHATRRNLLLCFPTLSEDERETLLQENYRSVGIALLESAMAWWSSSKRVKKLLHLQGSEHLDAAKAQERGVILVSAHFTGLELAGRLIAETYPISISYREQKQAILEWIMLRSRKRYYQRIIERNAIRQMMRSLKNQDIVFYAVDTDVGSKGIFIPFFGIPAATVTATSRYAKATNAEVMAITFSRRSDKTGYDLIIHPPFENFPSDDIIRDTTQLTTMVEDAIKQHPEQYLWQYRRFKSRPNQEPCIYD